MEKTHDYKTFKSKIPDVEQKSNKTLLNFQEFAAELPEKPEETQEEKATETTPSKKISKSL